MMDFPDFFDILSWKLVFALVIICIIRAYLKGAQFRERASCKGLVAVVTGCSGGIGKQVVRELNGHGARVHMLCRDQTRADAALAYLVQEGCDSSRLLLHHVDLASFNSIRKFTEEFLSAETKVDILMNNAGIVTPKFKLTEDGHELTWQTNYLGHFLLTELLLDALRAAAGGCVVNVSSLAHIYANSLDVDAVDLRDHFDIGPGVCPQQARAGDARARVDAASHPDVVYTSILRNTPLGTNRLLTCVVAFFARFLLKMSKDGAQTPVHLSLSSALASVSASYFASVLCSVLPASSERGGRCSEMTERQLSAAALDDRACTDLYERSLAICALDASAADAPADAAVPTDAPADVAADALADEDADALAEGAADALADEDADALADEVADAPAPY